MSTNSLFPDKPHKDLSYCKFVLDENNKKWICTICNNFISQQLVGDNPPYAICRKSKISFVNKKNVLESPASGVGTALKGLLNKIGIKATPNCSCNKRAKIMDQNGIEWCENNIDIILGWLKEEAVKRKLPFLEIGAKILIKKAISDAKKNNK